MQKWKLKSDNYVTGEYFQAIKRSYVVLGGHKSTKEPEENKQPGLSQKKIFSFSEDII